MVTISPSSFGDLLRRHRLAAGLTQEDLAEHAGLSVRAISDLERATRHVPRKATVQLLLEALPVSERERGELEAAARRMSGAAPSGEGPDRRLHAPAHPLTLFVGRERELAELGALLRRPEVRLVTLTGPGGIGKTRLALQLAASLAHAFRDGVCVVSLAHLAHKGPGYGDADLVTAAIAEAVGVRERGGGALADTLKGALHDRQLLLVLDNFEHLLPASSLVADLLAGCPQLRMLVTTRAVLRLSGERVFEVPPLAVPAAGTLPDLEVVGQSEAVRLFCDRAQAAKADFALTRENAEAIVELCRRLDGLPLAIELAASRSRVLSPRALLARLSGRLDLVRGGARDLPARQQTLRGTIAWSYQLLDEGEQQVFTRLAVFAGGCTLAAAEAVCRAEGDLPGDVLEGLSSLVDKSLLGVEEQEAPGGHTEPRFVLLETIREYALEKLAERDELLDAQRAHAAYYLRLAEEAEVELEGPRQVAWLARLEREHDNLRAALRWALAPKSGDGGERRRELALRLGGALWQFWYLRAHLTEGQIFLERAIACGGSCTPEARAKALIAGATLMLVGAGTRQAPALAEESLAFYREAGNPAGIAFCLFTLGVSAIYRREHARARALLEESVALLRELRGGYRLGRSLMALGLVDLAQGQMARACARYEEALALFRERSNTEATASVLFQLGLIHFYSRGDALTARAAFEEACALLRQVGQRGAVAVSLIRLAEVALLGQGDVMTARRLAEEALALFQDMRYRGGMAEALFVLARVEARQGSYVAARGLYDELLSLVRERDDTGTLSLPIPYRVHLRGFIPKQFDDALNLPFYLEGLAEVVAAQGEGGWAARLLGAAESLREALPSPRPSVFQAEYEQTVAAARRQLGQTPFAVARKEGRTMTPERALGPEGRAALAEEASRVVPPATARIAHPAGLSAREAEVLRLVAQGLTNDQIAAQLVISYRTVTTHLTSIYTKLDVGSRSAATRFAVDHHLA